MKEKGGSVGVRAGLLLCAVLLLTAIKAHRQYQAIVRTTRISNTLRHTTAFRILQKSEQYFSKKY